MHNEFLFSSLIRCGHCRSAITGYKKPKRNKVYSYYRCQKAIKETAEACPMGQINSVDIEAIGVSYLRLLSIDESLLKAVLEHSSINNSTELAVVKGYIKQAKRQITSSKSKEDNYLTALGLADTNEVKESILDKVKTLNSERIEIEDKLKVYSRQLEELKQPIDNMDNMYNSYQSFWRVWTDLNTDDRKLAIKCIVKEFRLFKINDKNYRLEMDLHNDLKNKAFASEDEGLEPIVQYVDSFGSGGRI